MAEAFVFINTFKVKEGKLNEYRQFVDRMVPAVEEGEPDMMQYGLFFNEEALEATALQVHRNVENFAFHMNLMSQLIEESRDLIEFADMSVTIYGTPTESILEQMRQMAGTGVKVSISGAITSFDRYH
ncbi:MAG: putative quinol monooxygenase [Acidimicrobiia bacterium]